MQIPKGFLVLVLILCCSGVRYIGAEDAQENQLLVDGQRIIKEIVIEGNRKVPSETIARRIPYRPGMVFQESLSPQLISNLYDLGFFRQIELEAELIGDDQIRLFVMLEEKKSVESLEFEGNKKFGRKHLVKKLDVKHIEAIDEEVAQRLAFEIKQLYKAEGYFHTNVDVHLDPLPDDASRVAVRFVITEGPHARLVRVHFQGNEHVSDRELRSSIFSREDWILGFMNEAGMFKEDEFEKDKLRLSMCCQNKGFLTAHVTEKRVDFSPDKKSISVVFTIEEGDRYTVGDIKVIDDQGHDNDDLVRYLDVKQGDVYSRDAVMKSMETIKNLVGERGYIFAEVYPQPVQHEETKTVDLLFHLSQGNNFYANRITITGNRITRDKVIRRNLEIVEGDLITTQSLDRSRRAVEFLSFFERDGVAWKIHRLNDTLADLELAVKETRTGNFSFNLSAGSEAKTSDDPRENKEATRLSVRAALMLSKDNVLGLGYNIGSSIQFEKRSFRQVEGHFANPHLFDSDVSGAFSVYHRHDDYDQWKFVNITPKQKTTGLFVILESMMPSIDRYLGCSFEMGIERVRNNHPRAVGVFTPQEYIFYQAQVQHTFQEGTLQWFALNLAKDLRNHRLHPSEGYRLSAHVKLAPALTNDAFSFIKTEFEASFYTPLILPDYLVLVLHGRAGNIQTASSNKIIPYKELFHMGGQHSVRGFSWGSIGPSWLFTDGSSSPIGSRHAVQFNAELIFPLIPDYSMKGHLFYDAGAGWSAPQIIDGIHDRYLIRNKFDLRQSMGFGIKILKPTPARIDWGFKLDRKKGESPSEFHLSMDFAW